MCGYTYIYTHTYVSTLVYIYICVDIYIYTHIQTYTHTCICMHLYIHTYEIYVYIYKMIEWLRLCRQPLVCPILLPWRWLRTSASTSARSSTLPFAPTTLVSATASAPTSAHVPPSPCLPASSPSCYHRYDCHLCRVLGI